MRAGLLLLGLLFALSAVGVDLTALSVLGGALGVGLGFGLQKLAANYVSGFVILLERSLRIGDNVRVDNFEGRITDIVEIAVRLADGLRDGALPWRQAQRLFRHTRRSDAEAIAYHYDVSNAFYEKWLDPRMVYSCAYFKQPSDSLEQAQLQKIDHILTKLRVQPGDRLLDIGCGWGALVIRAAEKFGARALGITLSAQQHDLACQRIAAAGLDVFEGEPKVHPDLLTVPNV
ncbi:hypothetical protein KXX11_003456, partial [Aspergillus fumigatus]